MAIGLESNLCWQAYRPHHYHKHKLKATKMVTRDGYWIGADLDFGMGLSDRT